MRRPHTDGAGHAGALRNPPVRRPRRQVQHVAVFGNILRLCDVWPKQREFRASVRRLRFFACRQFPQALSCALAALAPSLSLAGDESYCCPDDGCGYTIGAAAASPFDGCCCERPYLLGSLGGVRDGLQALISACPGHGRTEACPILNALAQENAHAV